MFDALSIFSSPSTAAEVVLKREHTIDGRVVDVKAAVARDKAPAPTRYSNTTSDSLGALFAFSVYCLKLWFCIFVHRYCVYFHIVEEIVGITGSTVVDIVKRYKYCRNWKEITFMVLRM